MIWNLFKKKKSRKIILNCEKIESRMALLNAGRLEEYKVERKGGESIAGSVYLGKIVNISQSLEAAFVDIGTEKHGFLHFKDMIPATYDMIESSSDKENILSNAPSRRRKTEKISILQKYANNLKNKKGRVDLKDVPKLFPAGSEVIVQVVKDSIGTKGPKLSTNIAIPGRYVVLLPFSARGGVSRKIENAEERRRLHSIMRSLDLPEGMGCICRTNGEGRKEIYFKNDFEVLLASWNKYAASETKPKAPFLIFKEPNLIERTVRDFVTEEIDEIIIDDPETYNYVKKTISSIIGANVVRKISLHKKAEPIFEYFGAEKQTEEIFGRTVKLRGGGFICIDETEALIAIDVNSGSKQGKDHPETILHTNLDAAEEIARQIRLRNIGGIVVIDFIDMRPQTQRDLVFKTMLNAVENDSAETKILPITKFGLMEMTRQRESESLSDAVFDPCPYCAGKGIVKSPTTIRVEIQRAINKILRKYNNQKDFSIRINVHPQILASIKNKDGDILNELEQKYGRHLSFRADPSLHFEKFIVNDPLTGVEINPDIS
jgi:ribonuclease G